MSVAEALLKRRSVRGFLDRPIPIEVIRRLVAAAARAPSGGNLQPWHIYVVTGTPLEALKSEMARRVVELPRGETKEYDIYPPDLWSPYNERRYQVGEALYGVIGIPREDKAARRRQFSENFRFFGAPVGLFCYIHRRLGPPQWSDLGMYLQSLMLLAVEEGLATCPQECWSVYPQTVAQFVSAPPELMLFCGMALGYEDTAVKANALRTIRASPEEFVTFLGAAAT
jgi:nitroreductase